MFRISRAYLFGNILILLFSTGVNGQNNILPSTADSAFKVLYEAGVINRVEAIGDSSQNISSSERMIREGYLAEELTNMTYRKLGIEFWERFPNDVRKYEWFATTLNASRSGNHYWKNPKNAVNAYFKREHFLSSYEAELDYEALWKWEKLYPVFREEYFRYLRRTGQQDYEVYILRTEIASFFNLSRNKAYRGLPYLSTAAIKKEIQERMNIILEKDKGTESRAKTAFLIELNFPLLSGYKFLGLNEDSILHLMGELRVTNQNMPSMVEWIEQSTSLMLLSRSTMNIRFSLPEGGVFDLGEWRKDGSVVLVDIWSLGCTSCIRRMSYLKEMYDKYKDRGFKVLSLCASKPIYREKVDSIKANIGADWSTFIIGSPDAKTYASELWRKYGFKFVPHMFLLNKSGSVVLYNHELVQGDIEPYLKKYIEE